MPRSEINFEYDKDNHLTVIIGTERLDMCSVATSDLDNYKHLLGKAENMVKYTYGKPYDAQKTQECVDTWAKRWEQDNPFSSFVVSKNDTEEFIGTVVLGHTQRPGSSELAYIFDHKFWGQGYGKESVVAIVKEYAPALVKKDYRILGNTFTSIEATTRPDNEASVKVLEAAGMRKISEHEKFGHNRYNFFVTLDELMQPQADVASKNLQFVAP